MHEAESDANATALLEARARRLALPAAAPMTTDGRPELLQFEVGGTTYAIDLRYARGVIRDPRITPLPHLPPHVVGVTEVRGEVVLVVDLARLLGAGDGQPSPTGDLLLLAPPDEDGAGPLALVVNQIALAPVEETSPTDPSPHLSNRARPFVESVTRSFTFVLNGPALLHGQAVQFAGQGATEAPWGHA